MDVVLLRVAIDTGAQSGGILGPIFEDGSFEYVPIVDIYGVDSRTYGNTRGRKGKELIYYFPLSRLGTMRNCPMHVDPEFETFTYGDPTTPKTSLRSLSPGDLLVFYAGLRGWDFTCPDALYIIGYFEVALAGVAGLLRADVIAREFRSNFHVLHQSVYDEEASHLALVKGGPGSRLLSKAHRISSRGTNRLGKPLHILSEEAQKVFGCFEGKVAIERSPPRWVDQAHAKCAAAFVRALG